LIDCVFVAEGFAGETHMSDPKFMDFQSRLRWRIDQHDVEKTPGQFNARMDCAHAIIPVLARAIENMRALGAGRQMIANTLRIAVEEIERH
jgi:hypothetical protein